MSDPRDQGITRLFADSRDALRRYVRRLVGNRSAADEIVQEAFLRTYTGGRSSDPLRPYLFSIARNLAFKARRHDRVVDAFTTKAVDAADMAEACASAEEVALADERISLLNEAISSLPPQRRAVFTLRMFQGRSYKEIAAQLSISTKTVEKHIALAASGIHAALSTRYRDGRSS